MKYPTVSAATSRSSPVMKTAEHIVLGDPEVPCQQVAGGGSQGVFSSKARARALRASRDGSSAPEVSGGVIAPIAEAITAPLPPHTPRSKTLSLGQLSQKKTLARCTDWSSTS
jgi:hypothetical protein